MIVWHPKIIPVVNDETIHALERAAAGESYSGYPYVVPDGPPPHCHVRFAAPVISSARGAGLLPNPFPGAVRRGILSKIAS